MRGIPRALLAVVLLGCLGLLFIVYPWMQSTNPVSPWFWPSVYAGTVAVFVIVAIVLPWWATRQIRRVKDAAVAEKAGAFSILMKPAADTFYPGEAKAVIADAEGLTLIGSEGPERTIPWTEVRGIERRGGGTAPSLHLDLAGEGIDLSIIPSSGVGLASLGQTERAAAALTRLWRPPVSET